MNQACKKHTISSDNNTEPTQLSRDSSILYSLNLKNGQILDSSVYLNNASVIRSSYKIFEDSKASWIEFGTEYNGEDGIFGDYSNAPFLFLHLPEKKLKNTMTIYLELKNSPTSAPNLQYWDTTDNGIIASLGNVAYNNQTGPINLFYSFQRNKLYTGGDFWIRRVDWKTSDRSCNETNSSYYELYNMFPVNEASNLPFSVTQTLKFLFVSDGLNTSFYVNGYKFYSDFSAQPISIEKCQEANNSFSLLVNRGIWLKNIKIWNRALSNDELGKFK